jgi:fructose-bisphosphate aldolase class II
MISLRKYLQVAREQGIAIGHFNFATADVLRAIVEGAQRAHAPCVMVGTSEKEAEYLGMTTAVALVRAIREASGFPVFLNSDHFKSFEACRNAIDAGYDTVLFDGGALSLEENITQTRRVVEYARSKGDIPVEGEIGYLKGSSQVQENVAITSNDYTKPDQAHEFVARTEIDRLAIVFGNIHGIVTQQEEVLDIPHLVRVAAQVPQVALVLHGASGLPDAQVQAAIKAGIVNVHFNTELRVAWQQGLKDELSEHPAETTPYKVLAPALERVREVVESKCRMFAGR